MMPLIARIVKRTAILLFGVVVIYLAVWRVFPFFDNRTPAYLALLCTYIAMAYFIIPLLFRVYRLFYHPIHLPLYCTTPDGFASDPINLVFIGTRRQVIQAMAAAGWRLADKHSLLNVARAVVLAATGNTYPNAPMSNLYLFGRKQEFGFEVQISGSRGMRHHVRFWATDMDFDQKLEQHVKFWRRFYRPGKHHPDARLWVGAASKDSGFAPIRHNAQLTHMIDPDTNSERELIIADLRKGGHLKSIRRMKVNHPFSLRNRALRGYLTSDGKVAVVELK
jgi:uncharacterized membrane protein YhdT